MNKTEAIKLLTTDVAAWNKYRDEHREWRPNLGGADLRFANLRSANLGGADLRGANLRNANIWGADLRSAKIRGADFKNANLRDAKLTRSQVQPWTGEPDWQDEA